MHRALLAIALAVLTRPAGGETNPARVEITVEKKLGARARAMDPGHVFEQGDLVRFRFRSSTSGYLYVLNRSTSGKYTLLFPKDETGTRNQIDSSKDYLVPAAGGGWFRIEGPPGHETVYWVVTPADLAARSDAHETAPIPPLPPVRMEDLPVSMMPRCDDTIFRARGDCVDVSAGPKAVQAGESLPPNLTQLTPVPSRDLVVIRKPTAATISSNGSQTGPLLYEFRLAHK